MALWTPAQLGSILALWLDANDASTITQSAGAVSQWADKSVSSGARTGNAATATQATASRQPAYSATGLNGMPALVPAGSQFLVIAAANQPAKYAAATGISAMCVITRPTGTGAIYSGGNNNNDTGGPELRFDQNQVNVVNSYTTDVVRTGAASAGPHLAGMDASSAGTTAWLDGTGTSTATNAAFTAPLSQIFCNVYGTDYFNGAVGEIVYTSQRLTTDQRQQLEGYLAWKWGLQALLPANHPYKAAAPTVTTGGTDATATGATLAASASLIAGSATGVSNGTAAGTTLQSAASLVPGSASAAGNATATGATLSTTVSLVPGAASGTTNATAAGATLSTTAAFVPGSASGTAAGNATATGATIPVSAVLVAGSAIGTANVTAAGATFASAALFLPGTASGASNGTASGTTLSAGPILLPGAAVGGRGATATGSTISASITFLPGSASASVNPYPPVTPDVTLYGKLTGPVQLQARMQPDLITLQARLRH